MKNHQPSPEVLQKGRHIRLLALDVDGVLTDGRLYFSNLGDELKAFSTLDGLGIKLLQNAGIPVALITGRESDIVAKRARNLGVRHLLQRREDKLAALTGILESEKISFEETAYIGDDLPDLPCIRRVGLGVTVPDAHPLVIKHAFCMTERRGGEGAVREVCDWILQARELLDTAVTPYL